MPRYFHQPGTNRVDPDGVLRVSPATFGRMRQAVQDADDPDRGATNALLLAGLDHVEIFSRRYTETKIVVDPTSMF